VCERARVNPAPLSPGVFTPARGTPHVWELESDAHLHNAPPPTLYAPLRMPAVTRAAMRAADRAAAERAAATQTDDVRGVWVSVGGCGGKYVCK